MMSQRIILGLLLGILGIATTVAEVVGSSILEEHAISNGLELDMHLEEQHRHLAGICIIGTTKTYYFEVTVRLEPDDQTDVCLLADQVLLGHDINLLLLDYGIGAAGADDDAVFLAGVCPQPSSAGRRKLLIRRGYVWTGGGGCRGCFSDAWDGRRRDLQHQQGRDLQLTQVTGSSEQGWFTDIYAPWLEQQLESAIANDIVPNHRKCLGQNPEHIEVEIVEIKQKDLMLGCDDGKVIETLQSLSLKDEPLRDRDCTKCASIDFSEYKDNGQTKQLKKGDYVKTNWKAEHGFTVSASGGYNPSFQARILDTGDQSCINAQHGTLEFGSPNSSCGNRGRGRGNGGKPGESGENCDPVGNVLVVQESNKECPDSNPLGGTIKFVFDTPVLISDIGLMDVDEAEQRIKITYDDGVSELFAYPGFGDNAVQRVICNKLNVKMLEVIFPGTGAITEINFCPECRPLKKRSGADNHCLITETGGNIMGIEEIAFDDFEDSNRKRAVDGWRFARLETGEKGTFSQFLGRYGIGNPSPYRTYKVPRDADRVTFELDFYEIDSWNGSGPYGNDQAIIYVDGEYINLGMFDSNDDEGTRSGRTKHGITWVLRSLGQPTSLGFASDHNDQKHHVTIQVPHTTGLMKDGKLRLMLKAILTGHYIGEAAGWDNIRVSVRHGCAIPRIPAPRMPSPVPPTRSPTRFPTRAPTRPPTRAPTPFPTRSPTRGPTPFPTKNPTQPPSTSPNCNSKPSQLVTFEDFQGSNSLAGWTNGRLETSEQGSFTKFLGRYGKGNPAPYKTFNVPRTADVLILEFDFYEIDSWDGAASYGSDSASVYLETVKIDLGFFGVLRDEGSATTAFSSGITMRKTSLGSPVNLGFRWEHDQKHHVVIEIPRSTGLFTDGTMKVKLVTDVTSGIADESGGWDNIRISSKTGCSATGPTATRGPTPYPTRAPTSHPSRSPTPNPTPSPNSSTRSPTNQPSRHPTPRPTNSPTNRPTPSPTRSPTRYPTRFPTHN